MNLGGSFDGDIVIGRLDNATDRSTSLTLSNPREYNSVLVRVGCTADRGQDTSFFFARVMGFDRFDTVAEATASFDDRVVGFRVTDDSPNCSLLPFTVCSADWQSLCAGNGSDEWRYDLATGKMFPGPDGILEMTMFPGGGAETGNGQGADSITPGNWGTVDIGDAGNSTADLGRQIRQGPNADDLVPYGGELRLDAQGSLTLNGDTGISAGISHALADIVGDCADHPALSIRCGARKQHLVRHRGFCRHTRRRL